MNDTRPVEHPKRQNHNGQHATRSKPQRENAIRAKNKWHVYTVHTQRPDVTQTRPDETLTKTQPKPPHRGQRHTRLPWPMHAQTHPSNQPSWHNPRRSGHRRGGLLPRGLRRDLPEVPTRATRLSATVCSKAAREVAALPRTSSRAAQGSLLSHPGGILLRHRLLCVACSTPQALRRLLLRRSAPLAPTPLAPPPL